jgi:hypothetical protein
MALACPRSRWSRTQCGGRRRCHANGRLCRRRGDPCAYAAAAPHPPGLEHWGTSGDDGGPGVRRARLRGLSPSTPARRRDTSVPLRSGIFGAEEYGIADRDPDRQPAMPDLDRAERVIALESLGPESRLARDERQTGSLLRASLVLFSSSPKRRTPSGPGGGTTTSNSPQITSVSRGLRTGAGPEPAGAAGDRVLGDRLKKNMSRGRP